MNTSFLAVIKQIIADQGEAILGEPQRLKGIIRDLAQNEPQSLRKAFGLCVENGAYAVLKNARDAEGRAARKTAIAQRLRDDHGLDLTLCTEALDILEAALYGAASAAAPPPPAAPAPASQYQQPPVQAQYQQPAPPPHYQQPPPPPQYQQPYQAPPPPQYQPQYQGGYQAPPQGASKTSGLWTAVLICNIFGLNWVSRCITGHIGTGILLLLFNIIAVLTLYIYIGIVLLVVLLVIWIMDLVKIGTKKWQMADGTYLMP